MKPLLSFIACLECSPPEQDPCRNAKARERVKRNEPVSLTSESFSSLSPEARTRSISTGPQSLCSGPHCHLLWAAPCLKAGAALGNLAPERNQGNVFSGDRLDILTRFRGNSEARLASWKEPLELLVFTRVAGSPALSPPLSLILSIWRRLLFRPLRSLWSPRRLI